jgi:hypothetical protein
MIALVFWATVSFVAGMAVMYLIARNSPEHFLKCKAFIDAVYQKAKSVNAK